MKKLAKIIIPYFILKRIEKFLVLSVHKYYSLKNIKIIIRKNTSDIHVFRQIFIQRDYNLPIKIKPKLIIDAGAYIGYSAIYFSLKYPNAKIIAIEPEKSNFKTLEKNTENFPNIKKLNAGLWYEKAFLKMIDSKTGHWGFMTKKVKENEPHDINAITVSDILKKTKTKKIDILKIDIEGAEKEIFSKNCDWIGKVKVLIIELHDEAKPGCSKAFYSAIKKYNWKKTIQKGENIILIK